MSNINYVPAGAGAMISIMEETYKSDKTVNYTPVSIGAIMNIRTNTCDYVPANSHNSSGPFRTEALANTNYIPCSSSAAPGPAGATRDTVFRLSWWEENSFFKYPYMLVSAFYGLKWKDNFRQYYNMPDDFIIIGDSGGFQNMTMNANLDPIEVLRWQEKHCQIGLSFDYPIFSNDTPAGKKEKQRKTADNAFKALNNRLNQNMKLYAVFQGHTVNEQKYMLDYYDSLGGLDKFDGIAIGGLVPVSGDLEYLLNTLTLFCYNIAKYKKPIHFFGLSGNKITPYILYMSQVFDLNITFDSSSYGSGAIRREYWLGNAIEKINVMETDYAEFPCKCPVCNRLSKWDELKAPGSIAGGLISLHNMWQTINYVEELKKNHEKEMVELDSRYKRFIDTMKEFGPDAANKIVQPVPEKTGVQKSIFSF